MDDLLFTFKPYLDEVFKRYAPKTITKNSGKKDVMSMKEWMELVEDLEWIDEQYTIREASFAYVNSKMHEPDESKKLEAQHITATDFLEMLCRTACSKGTASDAEIGICPDVDDAESPIAAYHALVKLGVTDEEGRPYKILDPPPTALCLRPGNDPRSLEDRVRKLLILFFSRLRDANAELCADGSLEPASNKFLQRMETAFHLAIGKAKPPRTWRDILENGK
jgi:hypothetical protein